MHTNFRVERVKKQELFQVVVVFVILLTLMFDVLGWYSLEKLDSSDS